MKTDGRAVQSGDIEATLALGIFSHRPPKGKSVPGVPSTLRDDGKGQPFDARRRKWFPRLTRVKTVACRARLSVYSQLARPHAPRPPTHLPIVIRGGPDSWPQYATSSPPRGRTSNRS